MSKLRELLERASADYKTCDANTDAYHEGASATADAALAVLDDHDAEVALKAKREQMEVCCKAICGHCERWSERAAWRRAYQPKPGMCFMHIADPDFSVECNANRIRTTWAKDHPEDGKHD